VVYNQEPFPERMRLSERDQKLARSHGAGSVLVVTTEMGCDYVLFNSQTRERVQGAGGGGVDPKGGREIDFGKGMAHMARSYLPGESKTEVAGARATLLDAARSDRDRARALGMLVEGRRAGPASPEELRAILDKDVVAAAIQLGTRSSDAEVRSAAWRMLSGVDDPAIVQALLQVIANDQDRSVRYQAINAARKFLDVPGVRETLLRAAEQDTDSQPAVFCCMSTVRDHAERAAVPDSEFLAWARRKLLDETLPGRSRLITLIGGSSDGRFVGRLDRIGSDAAGVVFEIGQRDPDPRVRAMAWDALYFGQADREFLSRDVVPLLLGDLRNSTNERVRAGAARILAGFKDNAEVSAALQRARTDSSIIVRRAVMGEGGGPVSAE
jgi:HEAT repeat protein